MPRVLTGSAAVVIALFTVTPLRGQEPSRFGLNLSVAGTSQVGVTYHIGEGVALRPAVVFGRRKFRSPTNTNASTSTDYGLALDALFTVGRGGTVSTYLGAGGSYVFNHVAQGVTPAETGHTAGASGLFGVRARIAERIHLYGELSLGYLGQRPPGNLRVDQVVLRTTPLAVLIYLK